MRVRGSIGAGARAALAVTAIVTMAACSSGDDATEGTLGVITPGSTPAGSAAPGQPGATAPVGTATGPAVMGAGFVSIEVQVAASGVSETLSLDRATVAQASLNPVTLNATCTPLDGGDPAAGVVVSVVDIGRIAGNDFVSAVLRFADGAPGEHDMTLEVGSADQVTTIYTGEVTVGADGLSGEFSGADSGGTPVTGAYACAAEAIVTTTTVVPLDAGEEVPEGSGPPPGTDASG